MHNDQLMQNQQIVQAFDQLNLTPKQIADEFNLNEIAVKAILMQFSPVYRKSMDTEIDNNFTDKELVEANNVMLGLIRHSEDDHLRFKVAKYIRDDKKGRLDIGKNMAGLKMDVTVFNQYLVDAREAVKHSKSLNSPSPAPTNMQLEDDKEAINV